MRHNDFEKEIKRALVRVCLRVCQFVCASFGLRSKLKNNILVLCCGKKIIFHSMGTKHVQNVLDRWQIRVAWRRFVTPRSARFRFFFFVFERAQTVSRAATAEVIENIKPEQMKTDVFLKSTRQALTVQSKQFEYELKRGADNSNVVEVCVRGCTWRCISQRQNWFYSNDLVCVEIQGCRRIFSFDSNLCFLR